MFRERPEVFQGDLEECLVHYRNSLEEQAPRGSKGSSRFKEPIAQFCGVGVPSITRWFRTPVKTPIGEQRIRLLIFLDLIGYRVIELERMDDTHRNFVELIGFGIISCAKAIELLGYKEASTLYHVLYGDRHSSEAKDQLMWEICKSKRRELEERKKISEATIAPVKGSGSQASRYEAATTMAAVNIMRALLALLGEESTFNKLSTSELDTLRQSEDGEMVFSLSLKLGALSEKLMAADEGSEGC